MRIDDITRRVKVDRKEVEGLWRNAVLSLRHGHGAAKDMK